MDTKIAQIQWNAKLLPMLAAHPCMDICTESPPPPDLGSIFVVWS